MAEQQSRPTKAAPVQASAENVGDAVAETERLNRESDLMEARLRHAELTKRVAYLDRKEL